MEKWNETQIPDHIVHYVTNNENIEHLCRICLWPHEHKVFLSSIVEIDDQNVYLSDMLLIFSNPSTISAGVGMPIHICVSCQNDLIDCYNFKIKCQKTESVLELLLQEGFIQSKGNKIQMNEHIIDCKKKEVTFSEECMTEQNIKDEEAVEFKDNNSIDYLEDLESDNENICILTIEDYNNIKPEDVSTTEYTNGSLLEVKKSRKSNKATHFHNNAVYSCHICNEKFSKSNNLQTHVRQKHSTEKTIYSCKLCKDIFSSEHDYQVHLSVHATGDIWKCNQCCKEFKTRSMLKRHIRRHMQWKRFACSACGKAFAEQYALRRHARVHTGEAIEKKHACTVCGKRFPSGSLLVAHTRRHSGARPFACHCGRAFRSQRLLASHRAVHSDQRPYACQYCPRRFRHESTRNTHHRTHTGEKPYVCSVCGKTFIQNSNMRLHMRTHTGEKPYECETCGKKFSSSSALKAHDRTHSGEKPYSCEICGQRFARMDRGAHMRRHLAARPHSCAACRRAFTTAAGLRLHTRVHTGERPYECATCAQMFPSKSHLVKHLKKHEVNMKSNKRQCFTMSEVQPMECLVPLENPPEAEGNVETGSETKKASVVEIAQKVPLEVTGELVIQGDGELLVVHNSPDESKDVYLNSNECNNFVNDLNLITVDGEAVEGTTVKLYQLDQGLMQIHTSSNQMTISKITNM